MEVQGQGIIPIGRFGHTLTLINENQAVLFGGGKGTNQRFDLTNEVFLFQLSNLQWVKIKSKGEIPLPRAAHSSVCIEKDVMIVFGGAIGIGELADSKIYNFDAKINYWKCMEVLGKQPDSRYGQTMVWNKPYVIMFGGNNGQELFNETWLLQIENCQNIWFKLEMTGTKPSPRVYHSAALCEYGSAKGMMCIFGGRISEDCTEANDIWGLRKHRDGKWDWQCAPIMDGKPLARSQHHSLFIDNIMYIFGGKNSKKIEMYDTEVSTWKELQLESIGFRDSFFNIGHTIYKFGGFVESNKLPSNKMYSVNLNMKTRMNERIQILQMSKQKDLQSLPKKPQEVDSQRTTLSPSQSQGQIQITAPPLKIIGKLNSPKVKESQVGSEELELTNLVIKVLDLLLRPGYYMDGQDKPLPISHLEIIRLITEAKKIIKNQPIILDIKGEVKVFGDLHGQYADLMRYFSIWGSPYQHFGSGDIVDYNYLFLGDYVDRGNQSLETMCLLLALKIKFPLQVHLLRGNHEDINLNTSFGFSEECHKRLHEDVLDELSIFRMFNDLFRYLPLAAVVNDCILCIHGGIGSSFTSLNQIDKIQRPIDLVNDQSKKQLIIQDILWSDPCESDNLLGFQPNLERDPTNTFGIVKFSANVVRQFLSKNKLQMIIRAHQCVMDGIEKFANGRVITVFSATDYCGTHGNGGAMLIIKQDSSIQPKIVYPYYHGQGCLRWNQKTIKEHPPSPPIWKKVYVQK